MKQDAVRSYVWMMSPYFLTEYNMDGIMSDWKRIGFYNQV